MAKKKTASGGMNRTERVAGTIFFLVYLLVMPLLATRIFDLLEVVLDTTINDSLRNVLYYYTSPSRCCCSTPTLRTRPRAFSTT